MINSINANNQTISSPLTQKVPQNSLAKDQINKPQKVVANKRYHRPRKKRSTKRDLILLSIFGAGLFALYGHQHHQNAKQLKKISKEFGEKVAESLEARLQIDKVRYFYRSKSLKEVFNNLNKEYNKYAVAMNKVKNKGGAEADKLTIQSKKQFAEAAILNKNSRKFTSSSYSQTRGNGSDSLDCVSDAIIYSDIYSGRSGSLFGDFSSPSGGGGGWFDDIGDFDFDIG